MTIRVSPKTQLSLQLGDIPAQPKPPVPREAVPALADLLLAAIGLGRIAQTAGGKDEREDHR
jgi:hypothetical protein